MKNHLLISFGQKVRQFREDKKLSQEQLAEAVGLHRTYIGMVERAEKNITLINISKIAQGLGKSIKAFFDA